jgi:hypothetical protein
MLSEGTAGVEESRSDVGTQINEAVRFFDCASGSLKLTFLFSLASSRP